MSGLVRVWLCLCALALYCAVCCAQAPPALKQVIGEVTSIDAAGKQIKLKGDDGAAYTVILGDGTSFLRVAPGEKDLKKATKIAFTDVMVGDRALALEKDSTLPARAVVIMTKGDLAQKHEQDRAEWQRRGITGVVTALNPADQGSDCYHARARFQDHHDRRFRGNLPALFARFGAIRGCQAQFVYRLAAGRHGARAGRQE